MEKYTIAASMIFVIVLLAPLDFFLKKSKIIFSIFLLLAALFNLRETQIYYKTARKQEWVKVIKTIVSNDQKKISIAMEGYYQGSPLEYYIRKLDLEKKIDIHYLNDFNDLKILVKDKDSVWLIHAGNLNLGEFTLNRHFAEESFSHANDLLQLVKLKQWPRAEK